MVALDLGLVQGPLGSQGGTSRQPNREFWAVWLCGGQPASSARWRYLIINLALNQTGPSYTFAIGLWYARSLGARASNAIVRPVWCMHARGAAMRMQLGMQRAHVIMMHTPN
jgi:hypothetical protein